MRTGRVEEAKKMATSVPKLNFTKEDCILLTLTETEWISEVKHQIDYHFDKLVWHMHNLVNATVNGRPFYSDQEVIDLWQKVIAFVETFYENCNYGYDRQLLVKGYINQAMRYSALGKRNAALAALKKAVACSEENELPELLCNLFDERFDFIRSENEFKTYYQNIAKTE